MVWQSKARGYPVVFGLLILSSIFAAPGFGNGPCKDVVSNLAERLRQDEPPTAAATARFLNEMKTLSPGLTSDEVRELRKVNIVFVPGFLSGAQEKLGVKIFGEQVNWLKSQGLESKVISYGIEHPDRILEKIQAQLPADGPLLVISHSKGSIIMMQLLVSHPELQSRMASWFSVSGTFRGSPLADLAFGKLKRVLPKDAKAALEVQTEKNWEIYSEANQKAIDQMLEKVPHLFVAAWADPDRPGFSGSISKWTVPVLKKRGYPWSDGTVPTQNGILGCQDDCVIMPQVDHFSHFNDDQFLRTLMHRAVEMKSQGR